jgi:hypothetical protein
MTTARDDHDERRRRSLRLLGFDPEFENERNDNPPPPDKTQPDMSQPLLSPVMDFTLINRTHEGRTTTSPPNAIPVEVVHPPVPLGNRFDQLGQDDTTTVGTADAVDLDAASTTSSTARQINELARATDDTIAAINARILRKGSTIPDLALS